MSSTRTSHRSRPVHRAPRHHNRSTPTQQYDSAPVMDCDDSQNFMVEYDGVGDEGSAHVADENITIVTQPEEKNVLSEKSTVNEAENESDNQTPLEKEIKIKEEKATEKISLTHTTKKLKRPAAPIKQEQTSIKQEDGGEMPLFQSRSSLPFGESGMSQDFATKNNDISSVQSSTTLERSWWCKSATVQHSSSDGSDAGPQEQEYVPMYWTDATETNGTLYLFGRVAVVEPGASKRFVSCCVAVHGAERNLFVLPKRAEGFKSDGSPIRESLDKVYADVNKLLVPNIIPRTKGQGFRCKQVLRKYAFDDENIPRDECEYLKVVYLAKHGAPSWDQCNSPPASSSIEKIFGSTSSALELFLLKRKLMGPSWILIKNPKTITESVSWCKLELSVEVSLNLCS